MNSNDLKSFEWEIQNDREYDDDGDDNDSDCDGNDYDYIVKKSQEEKEGFQLSEGFNVRSFFFLYLRIYDCINLFITVESSY
jgi:hypothetical protein